MKLQSSLLLQLLLVRFSDAWTTPLTNSNSPLRQMHGTPATTTTTSRNALSTPQQSKAAMQTENEASTTPAFNPLLGATQASFVALAALAACPGEASAAVVPSADAIDIDNIASATAAVSSTILTAGGSVSSALFAYGHYFSIIAIVAIIMTERLTLENGPNMTDEEENRIAIADTLYGVVGLFIVYTGYYRLSDPTLGKGTYFYIHEPIFWLKMAMVAVLGAASLFNTTKIIQRSITRFSGEGKPVEPMSEELVDRMKSICNAELTGIVFIPMAATFMARGIGYNESIPWQAEAAGVALLFLGLGFKYVKEALTFEARLETKKDTEPTNTNTMIS